VTGVEGWGEGEGKEDGWKRRCGRGAEEEAEVDRGSGDGSGGRVGERKVRVFWKRKADGKSAELGNGGWRERREE